LPLHKLEAWLKHSEESVFGTAAGGWPSTCNAPETRGPSVRHLHVLPGLQDTVVLRDVPRPREVRLLRTGAKLSYTFENSTLRVVVSVPLRTDAVDTALRLHRK